MMINTNGRTGYNVGNEVVIKTFKFSTGVCQISVCPLNDSSVSVVFMNGTPSKVVAAATAADGQFYYVEVCT